MTDKNFSPLHHIQLTAHLGDPLSDKLAGQLTEGQRAFSCVNGSSLLSAATTAGIKTIAIGCRAGGCGICKIRVLSGHYHRKIMSRAQITASEEKSGYALACRVYPQSDMLIEVSTKG